MPKPLGNHNAAEDEGLKAFFELMDFGLGIVVFEF